ncbi:hypothetical protein [Nocardioides humi]|uniref:Extradiol ring-cleavage dioxygenase LigAB LigA subunit domain-containing protein n=1 Tax=Nocardioides humi TaxID=449461 RepID=A0ABN2AF83_9ACTN|nr:hypothetical protein [Nocardioides humi]
MYSVQHLLWQIRKDPALAARYREEPDPVLDEFGVTGPARDAMRSLDFAAMYALGVNPYLLYFCALQLGVERADYYARLRGEDIR